MLPRAVKISGAVFHLLLRNVAIGRIRLSFLFAQLLVSGEPLRRLFRRFRGFFRLDYNRRFGVLGVANKNPRDVLYERLSFGFGAESDTMILLSVWPVSQNNS